MAKKAEKEKTEPVDEAPVVEMVRMVKSVAEVGSGPTEIFVLPGRVAEHIEAGWKKA